MWPSIAITIDPTISLAFVQPNRQSYGVGVWYIASTGDMLHRNVDSLAMLAALRSSDSKTPAIGNDGKLLGFLASLERLGADRTAVYANARLSQAYIYGKKATNSC